MASDNSGAMGMMRSLLRLPMTRTWDWAVSALSSVRDISSAERIPVAYSSSTASRSRTSRKLAWSMGASSTASVSSVGTKRGSTLGACASSRSRVGSAVYPW